jgi:hypothetical protein
LQVAHLEWWSRPVAVGDELDLVAAERRSSSWIAAVKAPVRWSAAGTSAIHAVTDGSDAWAAMRTRTAAGGLPSARARR